MDCTLTPGAPRPRSLRSWIWRYAPQDLVATAVALAWCHAFSDRTGTDALLGVGSAVVETLVFYAVAFLRLEAGPRSRLKALWSEYKAAEALDIFLRPTLMALGVALFSQPVVGVYFGSIASDLAFYANAARQDSF